MDSEKIAATLYGGSAAPAPSPAPPAAPPKPNAEPEKSAPRTEAELAAKMYPAPEVAEGPPAEYVFEIPPDLADLGLVPEPELQKEFSELARSMGLTQKQVTNLTHYHLRRLVGTR